MKTEWRSYLRLTDLRSVTRLRYAKLKTIRIYVSDELEEKLGRIIRKPVTLFDI